MRKFNKKYLFFIFLGLFLIFFSFSVKGGSLKQPFTCCKLDNKITIKDITCVAGSYAGDNLGGIRLGCNSSVSEATSCEGAINKACKNSYTVPPNNCPGSTSPNLWPVFCAFDAILNVSNLLFKILLFGCGVMIIFSSISIVYSSGDPKKIQFGKNILLYSIISLVLGLGTKLIPAIASLIIGIKY
ncbi:MAG: pilin [Minisyncoccia bacterium]